MRHFSDAFNIFFSFCLSKKKKEALGVLIFFDFYSERWRREKDLERECVREMEKKAGARVGAGTQRVSSRQEFKGGVLG